MNVGAVETSGGRRRRGRLGHRGRAVAGLVTVFIGLQVARRTFAPHSEELGAVNVMVGVGALLVVVAVLLATTVRCVAETVRDGRRLLRAWRGMGQ